MGFWTRSRPQSFWEEDPSFPYITASDIIPSPGRAHVPRPMTGDAIKEYMEVYVQTALNAMEVGLMALNMGQCQTSELMYTAALLEIAQDFPLRSLMQPLVRNGRDALPVSAILFKI